MILSKICDMSEIGACYSIKAAIEEDDHTELHNLTSGTADIVFSLLKEWYEDDILSQVLIDTAFNEVLFERPLFGKENDDVSFLRESISCDTKLDALRIAKFFERVQKMALEE